MIAIGDYYFGPGLRGSRIGQAIHLVRLGICGQCGDFVEAGDTPSYASDQRVFVLGSAPAVNVVFEIPAAPNGSTTAQFEATRYSRKHKLLLVTVRVPYEQIEMDDSIQTVLAALRQSMHIAAEVFARKREADFDLPQSLAIIDKVGRTLVGRPVPP